jgi:phage baseplate assembly protein V
MSRLSDFFARGVMTLADGAKKMRSVQVRLLADEVRDDLEHVEPYGFTSEPLPEAEAFTLFFDGDRSHGIVFTIADRRYRLKPLKAGEVAIFDDLGQKVHLTREGLEVYTPGWLHATVDKDTEITVGGSVTESVGGDVSATVAGNVTVKASAVTIDSASLHVTGAMTIDKSLTVLGGLAVSGGSGASVTGSLTTTSDITAGGISLMSHVHTEQGDGADTSAPK